MAYRDEVFSAPAHDTMSISSSLGKFPLDPSLREIVGLPWGLIIQPLKHIVSHGPLVTTREVARCAQCYAWVSRSCRFEPYGWTCSLCSHYSDFKSDQYTRYRTSHGRSQARELAARAYDMLEADDDLEVGPDACGVSLLLALVDASGSSEQRAVFQSSLHAAVDHAMPGTLFGLVTFHDEWIELHSPRGGGILFEATEMTKTKTDGTTTPSSSPCDTVKAAPAVRRRVRLVRHGDPSTPPTSVDLDAALPLEHLVVPVGTPHRDAHLHAMITSTFRDMDKCDRARHLRVGGGMDADASTRPRDLGGALQATLRYLALGIPSVVRAYETGLRRGNGGGGLGGKDGTSESSPRPAAPRTIPTSPARAVFAGAQLALFLAGPPNVGRGSLDHPHHASFYEEAAVTAATLGVAVDLFTLPATVGQTVGLCTLATLARRSGGEIFLYPHLSSTDHHHRGRDHSKSKGHCHVGEGMPSDVAKHVATGRGFAGRLRLRLSNDMVLRESHGRLLPDDHVPDLYHVTRCATDDVFAFDLAFRGSDGFRGYSQSGLHPPAVQMAFAYTALVRTSAHPWGANEHDPDTDTDTNTDETVSKSRSRDYPWPTLRLERRVRVVTMRFDVGHRATEIYRDAQPDGILSLLMHKAMRAATVEDDVGAARALLYGWLVRLVALYTLHMNKREGHRLAKPTLPQQVHVEMTLCPQTEILPRLIYALLRSPLFPSSGEDIAARAPFEEVRTPMVVGGAGFRDLSEEVGDGTTTGRWGQITTGDATTEDARSTLTIGSDLSGLSVAEYLHYTTSHPDTRAFLASLWGALPPLELSRAVYPVLESWLDPDQCDQNRLICSRQTVQESEKDAAYLVLDAYYVQVVAWTGTHSSFMHDHMTTTINEKDITTTMSSDTTTTAPPTTSATLTPPTTTTTSGTTPRTTWPPPVESRLMQEVRDRRSDRKLTPRTIMLGADHRPSSLDLLSALLIEEPERGWQDPRDGEETDWSEVARGGYVAFMQHLRLAAAQQVDVERDGAEWYK